jgi:hypothetical protein
VPLAGAPRLPPTASKPLSPDLVSKASKLPGYGAAAAASSFSSAPADDDSEEEEAGTPAWQAAIAFIAAAGAITSAVLLYLKDAS